MKICSVGIREWKDRALSNPRVVGAVMNVVDNLPKPFIHAAGGAIIGATGVLTENGHTIGPVETALAAFVASGMYYVLQGASAAKPQADAAEHAPSKTQQDILEQEKSEKPTEAAKEDKAPSSTGRKSTP